MSDHFAFPGKDFRTEGTDTLQDAKVDLRRERLLLFLRSAKPAWKDEDHPELACGTYEWVRSLREQTNVTLKCVLLFVAFAMCSFTYAQQPAEQLIHTTLCEIKDHPEKFLHKEVEFTAIASHGFEDSMVEDASCPWGAAHPGVWMDYGGTAKTDTIYCCGSTNGSRRKEALKIDGIELPLVENDLFNQFNRRLHPVHPPQRASDAVRATLRGKFFARQVTINGKKYWEGYGHMGGCMLFVVTQVMSIDPESVQRLYPE